MVRKTVRSHHHANKLVSSVAKLYSEPDKYCDVHVHIGNNTFKCHKLILALHSRYFEQLLFSDAVTRTAIQNITFNGIVPDDFKNVLRYLYTGEVELDSDTVGRIMQVAELAHLDHLEQVCLQFMRDTLSVETSVRYWIEAQRLNDFSLRSDCLDIISREYFKMTKLCCLQSMTQDMMKAVLERDDINVGSEIDVCDILMDWLAANNRSDESHNPVQLLSLIRWCGVNIEYIKSKMSNVEAFQKYPQVNEYLSRVITYRLSGIQSPGLRTHHRPSTGQESCVLIIGIDNGHKIIRACCRVSTQNRQQVEAINYIPTIMKRGITACFRNNSMYVTGLGTNDNEMWRWDVIGGWARCADMIQGRRRHCATLANNTSIYVLGGWVETVDMTLSSVERFDTVTNTWETVEKLAQCVESAGCVAFNTRIYLFGGSQRDMSANTQLGLVLDCIQEYNITTQQCSVIAQRLPQPRNELRAVLWDKSVILVARRTCLIFDLELKTIQFRDLFAPDVDHFGLVLDNQTLYVLGGGTSQCDSNGAVRWTCTDEVKRIAVMDIVNNRWESNWTQHSKLNACTLVYAYSLVTLPALHMSGE